MKTHKTVDGVDVHLDSYYVHSTYSGWYTGAPPPEAMIEGAKVQLAQMWGTDRPVLVVPPNVGVIKVLPERCMMAWLRSYQPPKEEPTDDGSHLFVVWFSSSDPLHPLIEALDWIEALGGWWKHAKGWCI